MNFLFWTILIGLGVGISMTTWMRRRRATTTAADSPVEAFSFTHQPDWPIDSDRWSMNDVQFLASRDRIRAVVTIDIDEADTDRRRRALQILAREIYRHTEVEAVFIEARRPDHEPDLHLFAADGRGWWGREYLSTATSGAGLQSATG